MRFGLMLCVCLAALIHADAGDRLVLASRDGAALPIVLRADASASERYAAEELRDYTERLVGVRPEILSAPQPIPPRAILLGFAGRPSGDADDLGDDGFRLVSTAARLHVAGSGVRGVLYGVYEVLERFGGCRWWSSWHETVPRLDALCVPVGLDETQRPAFEMREPYWYDLLEHPEFAARLRVNNRSWRKMPEKFGGDSFKFGGGLGLCHTFERLMPPSEFSRDHPEYFAEIDGQRVCGARAQLCLTNPDVLRIVTERVLERMRKDPSGKFFGISPNDGPPACTCAKCRAVDEEEGSQSGTLVRFVNAVAARVAVEHPDKVVETLAYLYSRKPPKKTRLAPNVTVCFCTGPGDGAPIRTSRLPKMVTLRENMRGWGEMTDQMFLWDYVTNFRHYPMPYPTVRGFQDNIRFFRENNARYFFSQGAYQGRHADFAELKAYLLAKWAWNPDLPAKELFDGFFAGYYGAGAEDARAVFDLYESAQAAYGSVPGREILISDRSESPAFSDELLERAAALWRRAEGKTAGDPSCSYNVRMSSFGTDYLRCLRLSAKYGKLANMSPERPPEAEVVLMKSLAKSLLDRMEEAKDIRLCEWEGKHKSEVSGFREIVADRKPSCGLPRAEIEERHFLLHKPGIWGRFVDDPEAEDGRAVELFNTHWEWAANFSLQRVGYEPGRTYRISARVRVEPDANAPKGVAFTAGIYDYERKSGVGRVVVRSDEAKPGYAWYDVCDWVPRGDQIFWLAPGKPARPGDVRPFKNIRIDKIQIRPAEPDFHYHSRHIPIEHLNLETPMGRVAASNGLHTVLEPDNLARLKSFGVDTVELRLTWWELEKERGRLDFSRFDRDIERVEKAGLQPGLMAWFNHPPPWYGGTRFKCLSHGLESTTLSPWDPDTLREADRLYAKVAERYGDRIKFVYVTGSGDYGEPCLPQGVRHYVFSSPHSHIGLDWTGDRFAREAWKRVSSVPLEDVVRGDCDRATAIAYADFITERTAGFTADTFRLVRRHFPHARYGVPIGHVPDIAHGQSKSLVVKRMREVSPDFTARWTGMAYLGEFGRCNALANRISSAARFYGCAFGEEAADYIGSDNAANAIYEAVANGCTMLHNDFGNIVRAAAVNVDLSHLPLVDQPVADAALLWPDLDEKEFSVRHATVTEAESATFTLDLANQAAMLRRQANFEMCDSLMVRDGFLKARKIRRLFVFGAPPPELEREIDEFKAAGGAVETVSSAAKPAGRTVYRTRHRAHESSYSPSDGRIETRKL